MALCWSDTDTLSLHVSILLDRSHDISLRLDTPPVTDIDLDRISDLSVECIAAAQAIETICSRVTRGHRWQQRVARALAPAKEHIAAGLIGHGGS
jgi:hypothetical protein